MPIAKRKAPRHLAEIVLLVLKEQVRVAKQDSPHSRVWMCGCTVANDFEDRGIFTDDETDMFRSWVSDKIHPLRNSVLLPQMP